MKKVKIQDELREVFGSNKKYWEVIRRTIAIIDEMEHTNDELTSLLLATSRYLRQMEELQKAKRIVS